MKLATLALELIEDEGLKSLSMRRLAERAGLGTMSLYRYFPDKEHLLEAVIDLSSPRVKLPDGGRMRWKKQVRSVLIDLRRELARHPSLARERFYLPLRSQASLEITDWLLATLRSAGFTPQQTVDATRSLLLLAVAFSVTGSAVGRERLQRRTQDSLSRFECDRYPALFELSDLLTGIPTDERVYCVALDALLDGLELKLGGQ